MNRERERERDTILWNKVYTVFIGGRKAIFILFWYILDVWPTCDNTHRVQMHRIVQSPTKRWQRPS